MQPQGLEAAVWPLPRKRALLGVRVQLRRRQTAADLQVPPVRGPSAATLGGERLVAVSTIPDSVSELVFDTLVR
jgi:hypothetical protein